MNLASTFRALGPIDAKNVLRDPLLGWLLVMALLFGFAIRWGALALTPYLNSKYQFDLSPYYLLIMSGCLLITPVIVGTVIGFLLLDQRDDRTLDALQVTPLTVSAYLFYRISTPMALSALLTIAVLLIVNLAPVPISAIVLLSLVCAPLAALMALALASLAQNKVQGFALSKASGVITLPPVVAYFFPGGWQYLFGVVPTYWPVRAFWAAGGEGSAAEYWACLAIALAYQAVLMVIAKRHFERVVTR